MGDYERAVINLSKEGIKFNYIFADPPYDLNCGANIAKKVFENNLLEQGGMLIIETDKSEKVIDNIDTDVIKYKEKLYGRTRISIMTYGEN